jgi:PPOX class probable F420-dependent enzyme
VDLLERPLTAFLSTLGRSGAPSVLPINYVWDGTNVWISTRTTRQKYRNMTRDPRVALVIQDPDDQVRYLELRGRVTRIHSDPTAERSSRIRARYGGSGEPEDPPDPLLVVLEITPERFGRFGERWE